MIPIPQDNATQQRMLAEVEASVRRLPRCARILGAADPKNPVAPSAYTVASRSDVCLDKRAQSNADGSPRVPFGGKLIIVCTKAEQQWRIARLSGIRGVAPEFVDDRVFTDEQTAQTEIFAMRLQRCPTDDDPSIHTGVGSPRATGA